MDALIRESLRSRPPLVDAVRMVNRPLQLAGRDISTGSIVMVSVPLVHHRAEVYPNPDAFRPARFDDDRPHPHEWVPFGGGTRRCLGADLAMLEMREVIATVLARARLEPDRPQHERARPFGTALVPSNRASVVMRGRLS